MVSLTLSSGVSALIATMPTGDDKSTLEGICSSGNSVKEKTEKLETLAFSTSLSDPQHVLTIAKIICKMNSITEGMASLNRIAAQLLVQVSKEKGTNSLPVIAELSTTVVEISSDVIKKMSDIHRLAQTIQEMVASLETLNKKASKLTLITSKL